MADEGKNSTQLTRCHASFNLLRMRDDSNPHRSIFIASGVLASVFISSINVFVIYGLLKTKQIKTLSHKLLILLSISDFFVGFLVTPTSVTGITTDTSHTSCEFKEFSQFIAFLFIHFSGMLVATIALDRYFHIRSLTSPNKGARRWFILGLAVFNFVLAFLGAFSKLMASKYRVGIYRAVTLFVILPTEMLYFLLGLVSYFMAMRNVRRYVKEISHVSGNFPRRDIEMAKTVVLILLTVIICFAPGIIIIGIYDYMNKIAHRKATEALEDVLPWSVLLGYLNSAFNSTILISRNSQLKSLAVKLVCWSQKEKDSGESSVKHVALNGVFENDTDM